MAKKSITPEVDYIGSCSGGTHHPAMQDTSRKSDEPRSINFGRHNTSGGYHIAGEPKKLVENDTILLLNIVERIIEKIGTKPTIEVLRRFLKTL